MKKIRRKLDEIQGMDLQKDDQNLLTGGAEIDRDEYCMGEPGGLCWLYTYNWDTWTLEQQMSFQDAWIEHCSGYGYVCGELP